MEVEIKEDSNPFLARVIITNEWKGKPEEARKLLECILEKWPTGKRVKFILTCGGFVEFEWPKDVSSQDIGDNKYPSDKVVEALVNKAEKYARFVLSKGLGKDLSNYTDYITLGIDSHKAKISTTRNYITKPHIELVSLIDVRNNKSCWTGKSYPTTKQERGLVRISNLEAHFVELKNLGKVMILGCHDLNMFNNRNWKNTGKWRKEIKTRFRALAKKENPFCVLHHPHTTVNVRTWLNAWGSLRKELQSVEQYAGVGRYYECDKERLKWDALGDVRRATRSERTDTIDFVVRART